MTLVKHIFEERASDSKIAQYWSVTLAVGAVVVGVVAFLLNILARTASQIDEGAAEVWRVGKLIANNTVHVPLLVRTNQVAGEILKSSEEIAGATARIGKAVTGTSGSPASSEEK
jgi:hypothetical protein